MEGFINFSNVFINDVSKLNVKRSIQYKRQAEVSNRENARLFDIKDTERLNRTTLVKSLGKIFFWLYVYFIGVVCENYELLVSVLKRILKEI